MYSYHKTTKGWVVNQLINGRVHCLGLFDSLEEVDKILKERIENAVCSIRPRSHSSRHINVVFVG
jgi:hypothetical protein